MAENPDFWPKKVFLGRNWAKGRKWTRLKIQFWYTIEVSFLRIGQSWLKTANFAILGPKTVFFGQIFCLGGLPISWDIIFCVLDQFFTLKNSFQVNVYVTPLCFTECSGHLFKSLWILTTQYRHQR